MLNDNTFKGGAFMVRPRRATPIPVGFKLQPDNPLDDKLVKFIDSLPVSKVLSKTDWYKAVFQLAMDVYEINPNFLNKYVNSGNDETTLRNSQINLMSLIQNVS